jgi:RimK-like ATP-grasp domain
VSAGPVTWRRHDAAAQIGPLAIYYEHPHWFERLFAELDRRDVSYICIHADGQAFDPAQDPPNAALFFNRMSPSAYNRGRGNAISHTLAWLGYLESRGKRVVNGERAFRHEISKSLQLSLISSLGLATPRTRVIHRPEDARWASACFRFPVVLKPNVGGSGVGIVRFESARELADAAESRTLALGPDGVGLVQEFVPARGGHIVRVECVGGRYLYAIRVYLSGDTFDLCPADICQTRAGVALDNACPVEAPKAGLRVEAYEPPQEIRRDVESIFQRAGIDVGGIEYVVDDRDGRVYYYDLNALSNFVADAPKVLGFDPFVNLVDFLLQEARHV